MAETLKMPVPDHSPRSSSALAPLREPLFRSLWIAAVISYTGTWMQNVGAGFCYLLRLGWSWPLQSWEF